MNLKIAMVMEAAQIATVEKTAERLRVDKRT